MSWQQLTTVDAVKALAEASHHKPQIIFKHSTRCATSDMARERLERALPKLSAGADCHFLDLIRYRDVSAFIAEHFAVAHESPQTLVIWQGACILDQSHLDVRPDELLEVLKTSAT